MVRRLLVYLLLFLSIVEFVGVFSGGVGFAMVASLIGRSVFYMVLGVIVYCVFSGDIGLFFIGGLGLTASLDVMLKTILNMPRPPVSEWLVKAEGPGFPSGHAAMSFSFALLAAYATRDKVLGLALLIHSFAVSYSRLVLHVHYPIDVIGGAVIGVVSALVSIYLYMRISDPSKYLLAVSVPSLLMSLISSYKMPDYKDSPLLLGLSLSLILAGIYMTHYRGDYLYRKENIYRVAILVISFAGLLLTLVLESTNYFPMILLGGLLFGLIVLLSRPLMDRIIRKKMAPGAGFEPAHPSTGQ